MKNGTLWLNQKDLKYLLLEYYIKFYNDDTIVIFSETNIDEKNNIEAKLKLRRKIKINNIISMVEQEIEEEEIKAIINQELASCNYKIEDMKFCYVPPGHVDSEPHFYGVDLLLNTIAKQKTL